MKTMMWLLKREFWEHRGGFFWAPIVGGGVFLLMNLMGLLVGSAAADREHVQLGMIKLDKLMHTLTSDQQVAIGMGLDGTLYAIAFMVMMVTAVVVFFYCLGSLYDERRDRSVLFWKSLPISDRDTVLSKVISATVTAPLLGMAAGIVTAFGFLLLLGIFMAFHGQNLFGLLFTAGHPFQFVFNLAASLPVAVLWSLPAVGWLMLCSVWARSKPFLWAVGMPVAVGLVSTWFGLMKSLSLPTSWVWKHIVLRSLFSMFPGGWLDENTFDRFKNIDDIKDIAGAGQLVSLGDIYASFANPSLWIGAAVGAAMIVLAMRVRRWRDDG